MQRETTRRAALAALLGAGAGGVALGGGDLLDSFAPLSGETWRRTRGTVPETVTSRHGEATVTYDDYGVPHVEADDEPAAYHALGFVHAADRLFEMDLIRRLMDGRLSAALGTQTVESDVFHTKMDFRGAAEASREALRGTETERVAEAYRDGVNAYLDAGPAPVEFGVAGYDADPWTVVDTMLVNTRIAWGLTGSFETLRRAVLRERLGGERYRQLYPRRVDHGAPILRAETGGDLSGVDGTDTGADTLRAAAAPEFLSWLGRFEPSSLLGSNHWAVSGEHTASGAPILAYDPHLTLLAPPVWYEQHLVVGDREVRGATFPGAPFVVVGETDHAAWGFTNTGADVMDLYTYETDRDAGEYRYRDGWREFETETRTVEVAGGENRQVTVRKTVHGPFLDREVDGQRRHVGVAWTGTSGTREAQAVHEFSRAESLAEYRTALRKFDAPTQNALYVDRDGRLLYKVTGQIPIRRVDGEVVRGDRVFDGSAGEAEWVGFEPFGQSTWEGFVPFEQKPGALDPDVIGTANQRPADDPTYPIGQSYDDGWRGVRIYERLDERVASEEPVDSAFMADLQRDTLDVRARRLVPAILEARDRAPDRAAAYLDALADWDYRVEPDSEAALVFVFTLAAFERRTWAADFEERGLDDGFWPRQWVLLDLPADDPAFDGDRAGVLARAVGDAVDRIEAAGYEVYGDYSRTTIDHQFGDQVPALNYPRYPVGGTGETVFNVHEDASAGSSWRQLSPMDGDSRSVIPGGQDGSVFSEHYADQLGLWAEGEYKPMRFAVPDREPTLTFEQEAEDG